MGQKDQKKRRNMELTFSEFSQLPSHPDPPGPPGSFCPVNPIRFCWVLPLQPASSGQKWRLKPVQKFPPPQAVHFNYHSMGFQVDLSNWAYKENWIISCFRPIKFKYYTWTYFDKLIKMKSEWKEWGDQQAPCVVTKPLALRCPSIMGSFRAHSALRLHDLDGKLIKSKV